MEERAANICGIAILIFWLFTALSIGTGNGSWMEKGGVVIEIAGVLAATLEFWHAEHASRYARTLLREVARRDFAADEAAEIVARLSAEYFEILRFDLV